MDQQEHAITMLESAVRLALSLGIEESEIITLTKNTAAIFRSESQ